MDLTGFLLSLHRILWTPGAELRPSALRVTCLWKHGVEAGRLVEVFRERGLGSLFLGARQPCAHLLSQGNALRMQGPPSCTHPTSPEELTSQIQGGTEVVCGATCSGALVADGKGPEGAGTRTGEPSTRWQKDMGSWKNLAFCDWR